MPLFITVCDYCKPQLWQKQIHLISKQGVNKPQGGTLIFSHIRRLGPFLGFKILNFNIFGGFQKINIFLGYEDFVDIFWGHQKIGLF